jgi:hypothetical protein
MNVREYNDKGLNKWSVLIAMLSFIATAGLTYWSVGWLAALPWVISIVFLAMCTWQNWSFLAQMHRCAAMQDNLVKNLMQFRDFSVYLANGAEPAHKEMKRIRKAIEVSQEDAGEYRTYLRSIGISIAPLRSKVNKKEMSELMDCTTTTIEDKTDD